jgi:hypothetical protein
MATFVESIMAAFVPMCLTAVRWAEYERPQWPHFDLQKGRVDALWTETASTVLWKKWTWCCCCRVQLRQERDWVSWILTSHRFGCRLAVVSLAVPRQYSSHGITAICCHVRLWRSDWGLVLSNSLSWLAKSQFLACFQATVAPCDPSAYHVAGTLLWKRWTGTFTCSLCKASSSAVFSMIKKMWMYRALVR